MCAVGSNTTEICSTKYCLPGVRLYLPLCNAAWRIITLLNKLLLLGSSGWAAFSVETMCQDICDLCRRIGMLSAYFMEFGNKNIFKITKFTAVITDNPVIFMVKIDVAAVFNRVVE